MIGAEQWITAFLQWDYSMWRQMIGATGDFIGEVTGDVGEAAGSAAGGGVGGVMTGLFKGSWWVPAIVAGVIVWWVFKPHSRSV